MHNDVKWDNSDLYNGCEFHDDGSGDYLDKDLVVKARDVEMGFFKKMSV